jgi:hypothetical protein
MINTGASWFNGQGLKPMEQKQGQGQTSKRFVDELPFIIAFLVMVLLIYLFTNDRFTQGFLLLLFFSIVVLNARKFSKFVSSLKLN